MSNQHVHPPSVDAIARDLSQSFSLPHAVLVHCAREAVREFPQEALRAAKDNALYFSQSLLTTVVNGTGVLLHTNLGRAPLAMTDSHRPTNLEFNLANGERGSRHSSVSELLGQLLNVEDAIVVNNNAAAVMLVLAALAEGRDVAVSRGESVEIGGGFRIPDVMEQSGARLVDVGTTNRTRLRDYERAIDSRKNDIALLLKVHPSNFSIEGFTEQTNISELATLEVPVVADIGSGLLDNTAPWLQGYLEDIPSWIAQEPAARQAIVDGADLITFSGDKLLGGPQCGVIAGRADLVAQCAAHPLMRALRPGGHTLLALQNVLLSYSARTVCTQIPFWSMATTPISSLVTRAERIIASTGVGDSVALDSLIGAGSAPGSTIASHGISLAGDQRAKLRHHATPVIARTVANTTYIDLRSVHPDDDTIIIDAVNSLK